MVQGLYSDVAEEVQCWFKDDTKMMQGMIWSGAGGLRMWSKGGTQVVGGGEVVQQ